MSRLIQYRLVKGNYVLFDADANVALEREKIENANDFLIPSQYKNRGSSPSQNQNAKTKSVQKSVSKKKCRDKLRTGPKTTTTPRPQTRKYDCKSDKCFDSTYKDKLRKRKTMD